jgi:hypothetical protein
VKGAGGTSLDHLALSQNISATFSIAQRVSKDLQAHFQLGLCTNWALYAHIPEAFNKIKMIKCMENI